MNWQVVLYDGDYHDTVDFATQKEAVAFAKKWNAAASENSSEVQPYEND